MLAKIKQEIRNFRESILESRLQKLYSAKFDILTRDMTQPDNIDNYMDVQLEIERVESKLAAIIAKNVFRY